MPKPVVYRTTDDVEFPGYGAVIAGNFVEISMEGTRGFHASIAAYKGDRNYQYQYFQSLDAAINWILETAPNHRGAPNTFTKTDWWEAHGECSLMARLLESGEYESRWYPMRVNSEKHSFLENPKPFPTPEEAIEEARRQADQWMKRQKEHKASMLEIKSALTKAATQCGGTEEPVTGAGGGRRPGRKKGDRSQESMRKSPSA